MLDLIDWLIDWQSYCPGHCYFTRSREWSIAISLSTMYTMYWICTDHHFSQANGRIATKLAHNGLQVSVHPGCAQGQRSRDTGTFVLERKSLLLPGKWLDRNQTCTRWSLGKRASRVCSRSRSRSNAHFLGFLEWATPSLTVWFKF